MPNKETDVHQELNALKADLRSLKEDMAEFVRAVKGQTQTKAQDVGQRLGEGVMRRFAYIRDMYERTKDAGERAYGKAHDKIEAKPITTCVGSFIVGMILGRLLLRR